MGNLDNLGIKLIYHKMTKIWMQRCIQKTPEEQLLGKTVFGKTLKLKLKLQLKLKLSHWWQWWCYCWTCDRTSCHLFAIDVDTFYPGLWIYCIQVFTIEALFYLRIQFTKSCHIQKLLSPCQLHGEEGG